MRVNFKAVFFAIGVFCCIYSAITAHDMFETYWATAFFGACALINLNATLDELIRIND